MNEVYVIDFDNGLFIYNNVKYEINPYYNYTHDRMEKRLRSALNLKGKKIKWLPGDNMTAKKIVKIDY